MTDRELNSTNTTFVAINISKSRHDILVQPVKGKRYRMTITNERVEHDHLITKLGWLGVEIQIGFEATENDHRGIAWRLLQAGFQLRLISSVALARTREALHNSWDKNDPKDAQVILYMLKAGQVQRYYDPLVEHFNDCQELSKTLEAISKNKTEVLHRLSTHYLPLYFSETSRFQRGSRAISFFNFLYQFPKPKSITQLSESAFVEQAWDVVGRKVSNTQLLWDIYVNDPRTGLIQNRARGY